MRERQMGKQKSGDGCEKIFAVRRESAVAICKNARIFSTQIAIFDSTCPELTHVIGVPIIASLSRMARPVFSDKTGE
jgi:hypothetical protein